MKNVVYPVIFTPDKDGYLAYAPDFDRKTFGTDFVDAIFMARDLICINMLDLEEDGKPIPISGSVAFEVPQGAIVSYVDVDMEEYRKKYGTKVVKKNCTIPAWLNKKAESLHINFSKTLQEALMAKVEMAEAETSHP